MERASGSAALSDTALRLVEVAGGLPEAAGETSPGNKWQHPPSFYCPISQQILHDPVVLSDGHTYERRHIERWLQEHSTSPVSNEALPQRATFPNHALRNAIEEYFEQVFSVHRRAIRKTLRGQETSQNSLGSNEPLLHTVDALMQCSFLMNADLSIEVVLRQIMDEAKTLLGAAAASVFLVDAERQELYSTVNSTGGELRIPLSKGIAGHVATTAEPLVINDTYGDGRFDKTNDMKTGFRTHNMMCVPLKFKKGGVLGVVQLINKTGAGVFSRTQALATVAEQGSGAQSAGEVTFTPQDLQFLQVFASQAAIAVGNSGDTLQEPPVDTAAEVPEVDAQRGHGVRDFTKQCFAMPAAPCASKGQAAQLECPKPDAGGDAVDKKQGARSTLTKDQQKASAEGGIKVPGTDDSVKITEESSSKQKRCLSDSSPDLVSERTRAGKVAEMLADAFSGWQFDAFALAELTSNRPLSTLGMYIFRHLGLVEYFSLDTEKLESFLVEVENGYDDANAYHNRAHAASVLHAMHALLEHGGIAEATKPAFGSADDCDSSNGRLERMACLLAAAVHDVEHVGVSNEFLVRIGHERALLYNDQHVNEQHHAAAGFSILSRPECNFLASLPSVDYRRLRGLVIELVVATDMAMGGKILKAFGEAFSRPAGGGEAAQAVPASGKDAVLLLQVAMKCADLGHLALQWDLHRTWVSRLEEEFFAQGDREKALGHPVSFLMDRQKPGCSKTQTGFFEFVVVPLFRSLVSAAPRARPVLDAVISNYEGWRELDMQAGNCNDGEDRGVAKAPCMDKQKSLADPPAPTGPQADALDASVQSRKRSGRARQRAAKWWAAVRRRTPSPEPVSPACRRLPVC